MAKGVVSDEIFVDIGEMDREERQEDLIYLFIDETDLDVEDVYSLVFMGGRKIRWQ